MSYTIAVIPSKTPGKVSASSSDGYRFTTGTPLLAGAAYWLNRTIERQYRDGLVERQW